MSVSYELRSVRGNRPVYTFDSLARAEEERVKAEHRGVRLNLVKVTRVEELIVA